VTNFERDIPKRLTFQNGGSTYSFFSVEKRKGERLHRAAEGEDRVAGACTNAGGDAHLVIIFI
jgi:hypothetical protein